MIESNKTIGMKTNNRIISKVAVILIIFFCLIYNYGQSLTLVVRQWFINDYIKSVSVDDVKQKTFDYGHLVPSNELDNVDVSLFVNRLISLNGGKLDNAIKALILNTSLNRAKKIESLWNTYRSNRADAILILDWLRLLQPIELTDELIIEFNNQSDPEVRRAILSLLGYTTYYIDSAANNSSESDLAFIGRETVKIQNLYKKTTLSSDSELSRYALIRLPSLLPTGELGQIMDLINAQYTEGKSVLDHDEIVGVWIEASLADIEAQKVLLPKLLEHLNITENEIRDEAINAKFYELIKVAVMEDVTRDNLKKYIAEHEPKTSSPDLFYDWLELYTKLSHSNADVIVQEYLLNGDARQRTGIVINRPNGYLEQFSEEQLLRIVDTIGNGARQTGLGEKSIGQMKEALGILSQSDILSISRVAKFQLESLR